MRKKKRAIGRFLLGALIPFATVFVIVSIALAVFVRINEVSNGNTAAIVTVMIITIFVLSVAFVIGDRIQRKITTENPVNEILDATERIAAGDFSVSLSVVHEYEKYNDYDLIKQNINVMAAELRKSEVLKTDFISNVSHEIKTPLSIIQSYISLLQGELDGETRRKYVQTVMSATKRLTSLITNILQLNKLENQQLNLEYESIKLHDMLAETVLGYEELIEQKGIDLDCDFDEVEVVLPKSCLETVWSNLVSNAIKFTENGGKISIKLRKSGKNAVVEVSDTGCGISPETGAHIFDKFYQGDTSHSGEGNGLGLALVKRVIDLIGGEISVTSKVGEGSTFRVVLKGEQY